MVMRVAPRPRFAKYFSPADLPAAARPGSGPSDRAALPADKNSSYVRGLLAKPPATPVPCAPEIHAPRRTTPPPPPNTPRQPIILPWPRVVGGPVLHLPLGPVTGVVEDNDDGVQAIAHCRAQFHARHLKGAVADQDERAQFGVCQLRPDPGRHGKPHRSIIGGPEKFRPVMNIEVRRAEQRIAHVRHHHRLVGEERVKLLEQPLDRERTL